MTKNPAKTFMFLFAALLIAVAIYAHLTYVKPPEYTIAHIDWALLDLLYHIGL